MIFWILAIIAFGFLIPLLAGAIGLPSARRAFDVLLVPSFVAMAGLMLWTLLECHRDQHLSARERTKWLLFLLVGGPITAIIYLPRRIL